MAQCKVISGLTSSTTQRLVLDSGAFFKNFQVGTDDFENAKEKLLGATKGGGSFSAIPTFRSIAVDGSRGEVKGTKILESWEIKMGASIVEVTVDSLQTALAVAEKTTDSNVNTHEVVKGKMCIETADYIDNITWVGNLSGSNEPVIIQIFNALNTKGLEFTFEDKNEAVIEMEFMAHFDTAKANEVPFKIYYPKQVG